MGHTDSAKLLQQTLDEEKAADKKLSGLAEGGINQRAADAWYGIGRLVGLTRAHVCIQWKRCIGGHMDHPFPWLRYVAADAFQQDRFSINALAVRNQADEHLGTIDGLVIEAHSQQPQYVVVDAGGWFKSKYFLVPIHHTRMADAGDALMIELTKERINHFPGFDKKEFESLNEEGLTSMRSVIDRALRVEGHAPRRDEQIPGNEPSRPAPEWWRDPSSLI